MLSTVVDGGHNDWQRVARNVRGGRIAGRERDSRKWRWETSVQTQPQYRTLRSWVYDTLRERIIVGDLAPGAPLVEARLSEEFGISRSPIREALRQLGQEGFVQTLQNSATTVTTYDRADVEQILEVRDLLESTLLAHAAVAREDEELITANELIETMRAIAKTGNVRDFARADFAFHEFLWQMAKRPRVVEILLPVADHARRYLNVWSRERNLETPDTMNATCDEHAVILDAVADRDAPRAVTAVQTHMRSSRSRILEGSSGTSGSPSSQLSTPISLWIGDRHD